MKQCMNYKGEGRSDLEQLESRKISQNRNKSDYVGAQSGSLLLNRASSILLPRSRECPRSHIVAYFYARTH